MLVCFYATLRQHVPSPRMELPTPAGLTARKLLDDLLRRYPDLRPRLLDEGGGLSRQVHVIINGRDAPYLERGLDTELRPTDRVDIFPAVGGGAGAWSGRTAGAPACHGALPPREGQTSAGGRYSISSS